MSKACGAFRIMESVRVKLGENVYPALVARGASVALPEIERRNELVLLWKNGVHHVCAMWAQPGMSRARKVDALPWQDFVARATRPKRFGLVWAPTVAWVPRKWLTPEFVERVFEMVKRAIYEQNEVTVELDPALDVLPHPVVLFGFLARRNPVECTRAFIRVEAVDAAEIFGGLVAHRKIVLARGVAEVPLRMARTELVKKFVARICQKVRTSKLWDHALEAVGPARKKRCAPVHLEKLPCFKLWTHQVATQPLLHDLRVQSAQWINSFPDADLEKFLPSDQPHRKDEVKKWKKILLPSCQKMGPLRCPLYTSGEKCTGGYNPIECAGSL